MDPNERSTAMVGGLEGTDNETVSNVLPESDLGGVVTSPSFATRAVSLVVEVTSA
jgi:hypothetical protein